MHPNGGLRYSLHSIALESSVFSKSLYLHRFTITCLPCRPRSTRTHKHSQNSGISCRDRMLRTIFQLPEFNGGTVNTNTATNTLLINHDFSTLVSNHITTIDVSNARPPSCAVVIRCGAASVHKYRNESTMYPFAQAYLSPHSTCSETRGS